MQDIPVPFAFQEVLTDIDGDPDKPGLFMFNRFKLGMGNQIFVKYFLKYILCLVSEI